MRTITQHGLTLLLIILSTVLTFAQRPSTSAFKTAEDVLIQKETVLKEYDPKLFPAPRQGGDDITSAVAIPSVPYSNSGTTTGYTNNYDEICNYSGSTAPDVVYAFAPDEDMCVDIDLCGSSYDTKLYVYENAHTPGAPFACNDDAYFGGDPCGTWVSALFGLNLTAGNTYYIVVDGYLSEHGDYEIAVTPCAPPCIVECPPDGIPENEVCGDNDNGGCNLPVPAFETVNPGDIICGTAWSNGGSRDTDWYEMTITKPSHVMLHADADAPFLIGRIEADPCNPSCPVTVFSAYAYAGPCAPASLDLGLLLPGTYWFWAGTTVFEGYPCPVNYWLEFQVHPMHQSFYFVKDEANNADIYLMPDVDIPTEIVQLTLNPAIDNHPSVRNGQMVWSSNRAGSFDLWLANLCDVEGTATRLTSNDYPERHPHFSHDGQYIIYTAKYRFEPTVICPKSECSIPVNTPCGMFEGLRIMDVSTGTVLDIDLNGMPIIGGGFWPLTNDNWVGHPSFSHDDNQIIFSAALDEAGTDWETYVANIVITPPPAFSASLSGLRRVTQGTVYPSPPNPIQMSAGSHFDHDDQFIYYGSTRTPMGNSQIFRVPASSVNAPVHPDNQVTWHYGNDYVPEPLHDGRVVITSDLGWNICGPPDEGASMDLDLFIIDADGSNRINLTDNDMANEMYLIGDEVSWFCGLKPNLSECTFIPKYWNICWIIEFHKLATQPGYLPNFPKKQLYQRAWPMVMMYLMEKNPQAYNQLQQLLPFAGLMCDQMGWMDIQLELGPEAWWLFPSFFPERWDLGVPRVPALISPDNHSVNGCSSIEFLWSELPEADSYGFQLSESPDFNSPLIFVSGLPSPGHTTLSLPGGRYYWRASATNVHGTSWSTVYVIRNILVVDDDLLDLALRVGDWLEAEPWHRWIDGRPGAQTPVQLHVFDPYNQIAFVEFESNVGGPFLVFDSDNNGDECTSSPHELCDPNVSDGWSGVFTAPVLTSSAEIQFRAKVHLDCGEHFFVNSFFDVFFDIDPPSAVEINLPDFHQLQEDNYDLLITPDGANIDLVRLELVTKKNEFAKGIDTLSQRRNWRSGHTEGGDNHCVPTAAAACLKYFADSANDNTIMGGLTPDQLVDSLAKLAKTNVGIWGTYYSKIASALKKWAKDNGDKYTVRGPMEYDWKTMRNELERSQDVLQGIRWPDGSGHMMTFNSIVNKTLPNGKIKVDFMDPWTGKIEYGELDTLTGQITDFTGAGPAGRLDWTIIVCPKEPTPVKPGGNIIPGPVPIPIPLNFPNEGLYWLRIEILDLDGNKARKDIVVERTFTEEQIGGEVLAGELLCADGVDVIKTGGEVPFSVLANGTAIIAARKRVELLPGTHFMTGSYAHIFIGEDACEIPAKTQPEENDELQQVQIGEITAKHFFDVYPNPTPGHFVLELKEVADEGPVTIEILSIVGEKITRVELPANNLYQFDLSQRQSGVYLIRVTQGTEIGVAKIIKR